MTYYRSIPLGMACLLFCHTLSADEGQADLSGPLKVVRLLWDASPASAATSLRSTVLRAVTREQLPALRVAAGDLKENAQEVLGEGRSDDPRLAGAVVIDMLVRDESGESGLAAAATKLPEILNNGPNADRDMLLAVWFQLQPEAAFDYLRRTLPTLSDAETASTFIDNAFRGDRRQASEALLDVWNDLAAPVQLVAIEPLTASHDSMTQLVNAVSQGKVSKDIVNTNQLRKWLQTNHDELKVAIEKTWGQVRLADNAQRQELVADTLRRLNSGVTGSVARGQVVYLRVCSQCHQLHNQGIEVGPNISGNGRGSLSQLVSNVLDPSLVIGEAFQARTALTYDGQVLSGLVIEESDQYLKLKLQGGKIAELDKEEDIELLKSSKQSLMPEGVESQMTEQELFDLFAYLCLVKSPETEDNALIPGTPQGFVVP